MRYTWPTRFGMQTLKRFIIWLLEISCEAFLLSLLLIILQHSGKSASAKDVLILMAAIAFMFYTTGYLFTTVILRILWRSQRLWLYSCIATVLFLLHFEILDIGIGGAFRSSDRGPILIVGMCIAFACSFAGSCALRKWLQTGGKQAEILNRA